MSTFGNFKIYIRLGTFSSLVVLVTAIVLTQTVPVDAEVSVFDSTFVERHVEPKNDEVTKTIQNLHTHTWSSFSGTVPDGSFVTGVSLVFTWSEVLSEEEEVRIVEMVPAAGTSTDDVSRGESTSSAEIPASDTPLEAEESIDENPIESEEDKESESALQEQVSEDLYKPLLQDPPEVIPQEQENLDTSAEADVPDDVEGEAIPDTEEGDDASVVGFMHVVPTRTYPLVNESLITEVMAPMGAIQTSVSSETLITEVSETFVVTPEEIPLDGTEATEEESTVDSEVNGEMETPDVEGLGEKVNEPEVGVEAESFGIASPLYPTREAADILYSFDGDSWTTLTAVNLLEGSEIELDMSMVSLESIPSLRVRVVYLDPQDATPLLFGNSQLKLTYTPSPVEVVLPGPSDQEPNFDSSFVRVDISSENIRAVVLERGGMLEFWYSVTNLQSGEVVWRMLSGGGAIQDGSPIAIKERTIFWFDRNQETLFGLSVDSESVFGVPYDDPLTRTFRLPFETEDEGRWQATYDPKDNLLKFERIRKVSS